MEANIVVGQEAVACKHWITMRNTISIVFYMTTLKRQEHVVYTLLLILLKTQAKRGVEQSQITIQNYEKSISAFAVSTENISVGLKIASQTNHAWTSCRMVLILGMNLTCFRNVKWLEHTYFSHCVVEWTKIYSQCTHFSERSESQVANIYGKSVKKEAKQPKEKKKKLGLRVKEW